VRPGTPVGEGRLALGCYERVERVCPLELSEGPVELGLRPRRRGQLGQERSLIHQQDAYLGDRPPTLADYLDEVVAADVQLPSTQKMLVIRGLEFTPAG
jgi:hypothetical protein